MKRVLLALCIVLFAQPAWAVAPTLDGTATSSAGITSTSHSHTFAADATMAIVMVHVRDSGGTPSAVTSVTVGGQAAELITSCARTQAQGRVEIWKKASPLSGAQTVAVDASGNNDWTVTGVLSLKNTAGTFGTCLTDGTSDSTVNTLNNITTTTNDLVVAAITTAGSQTCAPESTSPVSTEQYQQAAAGSNMHGCGYTEAGGASSTNIVVDLSSSVSHAEAAVAVNGTSGRRPVASILF